MSADTVSPNGANAAAAFSPNEAPSLAAKGWLAPPSFSPNETNAAARKLRNERRISTPIALLFGANAATQFAIQAWLAYGFAAHVWKLAQPLPWGAPIALDLFAATCMYFTYRLRNASLRVRAYAWAMLSVAIGAQVGASEGYADHLDWSIWGRVASLFPALFLAASLHALVIVAREMDRERRPPLPPPAIPASTATVTKTARELSPPPVVVPPKPKVKGRGRRPGARDDRKAVAVRKVTAGASAKAVAAELGCSERVVQLWVKAARDARSVINTPP